MIIEEKDLEDKSNSNSPNSDFDKQKCDNQE